MLFDPALALRSTAGRTQELPDLLTADTKPLPLNQHLGKVDVIEVPVFFLMKGQDFGYRFWIQDVTYRSTSVLVAEAFKALCVPSLPDSFGLSVANAHDGGSLLQRQGMLSYLLKNVSPVGFFLVQDYKSLHVLHLHEGDIVSLLTHRSIN